MFGAVPDSFLEELRFARRGYALPLHLREVSREFADAVLALFFPHFTRSRRTGAAELTEELARLDALLVEALAPDVVPDGHGPRCRRTFFSGLAQLRTSLLEDARALYEGDPAAVSLDEVVLAYPGFFAVGLHRIAHPFWRGGAPLFARLISEYAHGRTGVDIHPGARLDHGTGVVIGETAILGDRVKLYQGVTLGAISVEKSLARKKRHPTIGNDVVIYANATILGGDTIVGDQSVIGGNVWLTRSVPPRSVVTHATMAERARVPEQPLEFEI
jgi:serine O-acetyltransferase